MKRISVTIISKYRSNAKTTAHAKVCHTKAGRAYLYLSDRQMREAANRICYSGEDYPHAKAVYGYGEWELCRGGSIAYEL